MNPTAFQILRAALGSEVTHACLAFGSGVAIEALYALGVLFISERRGAVAGLLSTAWGLAFLVGINESFETKVAGVAWCIGLGVGTVVGVRLKRGRK